MSVVNAIPFIAAGDDGYSLSRSLRFRSSASAYLNRTPASAGNRQIWTWSAWVKLGSLSGTQGLFDALLTNNFTETTFRYTSNTLNFFSYTSSYLINVSTTAVFRDPSAWYHIILSVDTTQATNSNGVKIWVNGVQQTLTFSAYTQNHSTYVNNTNTHYIATNYDGNYFDGYMAEVNFIDGQALAPSSFGAFSIYNQWLPKKYAGTYGTNGFYLPFTNNASAATLGNDFSGNSNTWTTNNISVTAGATYDSMTDVPTLTSATAANYCVLNPLYVRSGAASITSANLNFTTSGSNFNETAGTVQIPNSGKFYWEVVITGMAFSRAMIGVGLPYVGTNIFTDSTNGVGYYSLDGSIQSAGTIASGATYTIGDVIGVAVNRDAGQVSFYKNNALQATVSFNINGIVSLFASTGNTVSVGGNYNFGQRPFTYTPPSGYVALNTFNL